MSVLKKISAVAMTFVAIAGLSACGDKVTISAENIEEQELHLETKKYVIATATASPPLEFKNDWGEDVGVDIELLQVIAESQGFTYELVFMPFNEILQALDAGEVDGAMAGISITEERQKHFDYSQPYLESGIVMAVQGEKMNISGYEDLAGKTVAVTLGTVAETFAKSIDDKYDFTIVTFEQLTEVYGDVMEGDSQALFEDNNVMGYVISKGVELKVVSDAAQKSFYGFAVPKGKNPELLEMFNKGLAEAKQSGKYEEILDTYIQE